MASGALFGSGGARSQNKNLVEFRAGKMFLKGNMAHADKRKGLLYVYQSDDALMHFCWKDRTTGVLEDDLIIFPDDCEFKHVPQCTTGRVYVLKFKSSSKKFICWMQEPKCDKDEEYTKKMNEYLNNPPTPGSSRGAGPVNMSGLPPELANLGNSDLQNILGSMSQQQLMQLIGGMGMGGLGGVGGLSSLIGARPGSAQSSDAGTPLRVQSSPGPRAASSDAATPVVPRPVTAAALPSQETGPPGSAPPNIQLTDLQNILSNIGGAGGLDPPEGVDLSQAISPEAMIPILANPDVREQLLGFLPQGETLPQTEQELRTTISSPQFQQAMTTFSHALASGQLGPLMGQFGLGEDVVNAAAQGNVEAFAHAMQAAQNTDKSGDKKEEGKEEKMDEG